MNIRKRRYIISATLLTISWFLLLNTLRLPDKPDYVDMEFTLVKQQKEDPTSLREEVKPNNNSESGPAEDKTKYRFQITDGKCVGVSQENALVVSYCDPTVKQAFSRDSAGRWLFSESKLCAGIDNKNSSELVLVECEQAIPLRYDAEEGRFKYEDETGDIFCVSADQSKSDESNKTSDMGARITLVKRCDKEFSLVQLLEEEWFLKDRKALLQPYTPSQKCNFSACATNNRASRAELLTPDKIHMCADITTCVTAVVKTARRPLLVLRLARSLEETLLRNLTMIVIDDGPDLHSPEIMDKIAEYPHIRYIVSEEEDLGIAEGRNRGVRLVKTKYFLSFDDDLVVSAHSNITTMLEMLDTTDAALVGGSFHKLDFAGFVTFENMDKSRKPVLMYYPGSCRKEDEKITAFPECFRCDLTANAFMARTQDVLEVGGWSAELKTQEHKDLFLRLKAGGKKVVYCPSFRIQNVHSEKGVEKSDDESASYDKEAYKKQRYGRRKIMMTLFLNHWNAAELVTRRGNYTET